MESGIPSSRFESYLQQGRVIIVNDLSVVRGFFYTATITGILSFSMIALAISVGPLFRLPAMIYIFLVVVAFGFPPVVAGWLYGPRLKRSAADYIINYVGCWVGNLIGQVCAFILTVRGYAQAYSIGSMFLTHGLLSLLVSPLLFLGVLTGDRFPRRMTPQRLYTRAESEAKVRIRLGTPDQAATIYLSTCKILDATIQESGKASEKTKNILVMCQENLAKIDRSFKVSERGSDDQTPSIEGIQIFRGCEIVGGRFEYKIKIENQSKFVITNVSATIAGYPRESLDLVGEATRSIPRIDVEGFRSPLFVFVPTRDCVDGKILGAVSFADAQEQIHTMETRPYTIRSVCDLLKPVAATNEQLKRLMVPFEKVGESKTIPLNYRETVLRIRRLMEEKNFGIVDISETSASGQGITTISGLARGKYTGKNVVLILTAIGDLEGTETSVQVEACGEDLSMLPTTIAEISSTFLSWTCPNCGGPLTEEDLTLLKAGVELICRYCREAVDHTRIEEGGGI